MREPANGLAGPRPLPRIAFGAQCHRSYGQGVVRGVLDYVRSHGPWEFRYRRQGAVDRRTLARPGGVHGVITQRMDDATSRLVRRRGLPTVLVEADDSAFAKVIPDDRAIGRMAFEYFRAQGFRRFAYFTNAVARFSIDRFEGLLGGAVALGCVCRASHTEKPETAWDRVARKAWLRTLEPPTALLVISSDTGRDVLLDLHDLGFAVPDDIAVLSSENDEIASGLTWPNLSGIDINTRRIGYLAAELLDRMMHGDAIPEEAVRIAPNRVVSRASSDTYAVDDDRLRAALLFIRDHACEGATVRDVLRRVPVCRRTLEVAFQRRLGRTVHQEIVRVRLREARRLLAETDLPMPDVAVRCGYEHASNLSQVFRRELGRTPTSYRRQHRGLDWSGRPVLP